jgi:hypothetical protein
MYVSFYVFVSMTDVLFPAHSGFEDDNISVDAEFGASSSLESPAAPTLDQLETPLPQRILSMPISFPSSHDDLPSSANVTDGATTNKSRTEYHPRSRRSAKVGQFNSEEYGASTQRQRPTPVPWWPFFRSLEDFLVSELLLECHLSKDQADKLIKIIDSCVNGKGLFTLKSFSDVEAAWDQASLKLAPVSLRVASKQKR